MSIIRYLLLAFVSCSLLLHSAESIKEPILEGTAIFSTTLPVQESKNNSILPGTNITLKARVKNIGNSTSAAGNIKIRFAFLPPLNSEKGSVLFETESLLLPSIRPDEEVEISFKKEHRLPSVWDYVKHDWSMRQYEVVVQIKDQEVVIGRTALSLSAHYYQGPSHQIPKSFQELQ